MAFLPVALWGRTCHLFPPLEKGAPDGGTWEKQTGVFSTRESHHFWKTERGKLSTVKNMLKTLLPLSTFLGSLWEVTVTPRTVAGNPPHDTAMDKECFSFWPFSQSWPHWVASWKEWVLCWQSGITGDTEGSPLSYSSRHIYSPWQAPD